MLFSVRRGATSFPFKHRALVNHMLENVLRRDRYVIVVALLALTALAWGNLLSSVHGPMSAGGVSGAFVYVFGMWVVMMIGMMTPSAAPLLLLHARLARVAEFGKPLAATGWFAIGYLLAWTMFSFLVAIAQVALQSAGQLTPMKAVANEFLAGILLIAAGVYQRSSIKHACFVRCQVIPLLNQHSLFTGHVLASIRLGFRNGAYCVGCCWVLMLLLFVGGVMNLFWVAVLAGLILIEKFLPHQRKWFRLISVILVAGGVLLIYSSLFFQIKALASLPAWG